MSFLQSRLENVRQALPAKEIDALLLSNSVNVGYVTGFSGSTAYALVTPDEAVLITDGRYTLRAREECPDWTLVQATSSAGYGDALKETLAARPALRRLGFEGGHLTVSQWEKLKGEVAPSVAWAATEGIVEERRLIKDAGEIDLIRQAITVAEAAFETIMPLLKPGARERDIALELDFAMRRGGADANAFETIVASGEQGARPHHDPNERMLALGDFVIIDWGARMNGYNSDITRTVCIGNVPTPKQRDIYALVLEAQRRAIAAVAPGRTGKESDAAARDFLASHGYGDAFSHSLGHSLGRQTHDGPGLSARSEKLILQPGMVMTVEPGVYLEGWGGVRIEEDILVTEKGCEVLTHLWNDLAARA